MCCHEAFTKPWLLFDENEELCTVEISGLEGPDCIFEALICGVLKANLVDRARCNPSCGRLPAGCEPANFQTSHFCSGFPFLYFDHNNHKSAATSLNNGLLQTKLI